MKDWKDEAFKLAVKRWRPIAKQEDASLSADIIEAQAALLQAQWFVGAVYNQTYDSGLLWEKGNLEIIAGKLEFALDRIMEDLDDAE